MSGFGRKGLDASAPAHPASSFGAARMAGAPSLNGVPFGAPPTQPTGTGDSEEMSPQLRAFLAAERAQRAAEGEADLSTIAESQSRQPKVRATGAPRTKLVAYVLWYFAAPIAAHRFYLGARNSAMIMAGLFWVGLLVAAFMSKQSTMSVGGLFVPPPGIVMILVWMLWVVADLFLIPGLVRRYNGALKGGRQAEVFA